MKLPATAHATQCKPKHSVHLIATLLCIHPTPQYHFTMKRHFFLLAALASLLLFSGCTNGQKAAEGDYVQDSYHQRSEGYDWVAVTISNETEEGAHMQVRSRTDIKKATCSYDADLQRQADGVFTAAIEGPATMVVTIKDGTLNIATKNPENAIRLMWYCSGGGTLEGSYQKLDQPLDTSQIIG